jgi:hypothetical protein
VAFYVGGTALAMSIATTSAVSVATTLSVGPEQPYRCIECEQPYYRNRYYRRQFESLVKAFLTALDVSAGAVIDGVLSIGGYGRESGDRRQTA